MKKIKGISIILLIMLSAVAAWAQQRQTAGVAADTAAVSKLAADLHMNRQKALKLYILLHSVNQEQLRATNNVKIPMDEQLMLAKKILVARRLKIDSLLTPEQKALWSKLQGAEIQKQAAVQNADRQRMTQEQAQVPRRLIKQTSETRSLLPGTATTLADTLKHKKAK